MTNWEYRRAAGRPDERDHRPAYPPAVVRLCRDSSADDSRWTLLTPRQPLLRRAKSGLATGLLYCNVQYVPHKRMQTEKYMRRNRSTARVGTHTRPAIQRSSGTRHVPRDRPGNRMTEARRQRDRAQGRGAIHREGLFER